VAASQPAYHPKQLKHLRHNRAKQTNPTQQQKTVIEHRKKRRKTRTITTTIYLRKQSPGSQDHS
jgi:hypothetical protein